VLTLHNTQLQEQTLLVVKHSRSFRLTLLLHLHKDSQPLHLLAHLPLQSLLAYQQFQQWLLVVVAVGLTFGHTVLVAVEERLGLQVFL
jgi:hypothetical protein